MKIIDNNHGQCVLKGQHVCRICLSPGKYKISLTLKEGCIRINHGCYTPDGGTWLSHPDSNRLAHYDFNSVGNYEFVVDIQSLYNKNDVLDIVNKHLIGKAIFEYKIAQV